ncbi:MAG: alkaline phosphatase PhoX [Sphingomonas sp.]
MSVTVNPAVLGFNAVAKNRLDVITVPEGYTVQILTRLGDPIAAGVPRLCQQRHRHQFRAAHRRSRRPRSTGTASAPRARATTTPRRAGWWCRTTRTSTSNTSTPTARRPPARAPRPRRSRRSKRTA